MAMRRVTTSVALLAVVILATAVTGAPAPSHAAAMGNGKIAYVADDNSIRTVGPDGSGDAQLVAAGVPPAPILAMSWSPDGATLAWMTLDQVMTDIVVVVRAVDANGTNPRTLAVLGDSHHLEPLFRIGADELAWAPDGTRLLASDGGFVSGIGDIVSLPRHFVVMADASGFVELPAAPSPPSYDGSLVWSPDSARLAFTRYTATGGDLAVMDADGSNAAVIASLGTATAITPGAWTADGRIVASVGSTSGAAPGSVWTIRPDGTNAVAVASGLGDYVLSSPRLSPDASTVLVRNSVGLRRFALAGGAVSTVDVSWLGPSLLFDDAQWSPDGTMITVIADYTQALVGFVAMGPDGSGAQQITPGPTPMGAWQPVGVQSDRWRVGITGGITYSADASVTGNLEVVKDSSGVRQVHGFGTYTGAGASTASVALAVNRFWILPIHVGSVRVVDPGASLSLNHLVFFSNVAATATGSTSTQSWFDLSRWPWRSYSMTWQVDDIT